MRHFLPIKSPPTSPGPSQYTISCLSNSKEFPGHPRWPPETATPHHLGALHRDWVSCVGELISPLRGDSLLTLHSELIHVLKRNLHIIYCIYIILQIIYAVDISKQNNWLSFFFFAPEEDKIYSRAQYNKNMRVSKKGIVLIGIQRENNFLLRKVVFLMLS